MDSSRDVPGGPLDIFEDDDLARAQQALSDTSPAPPGEPSKSGRAGTQEKSEQLSGGVPEHEDRAVESEQASEQHELLVVEPTTSHLKFRVRQSTRAEFDAFKAELSQALGGVRLNDSNVGRAIMDWFLSEASESVLAAARNNVEPIRRPPGNDPTAMMSFDMRLGAVLVDGLSRLARDA